MNALANEKTLSSLAWVLTQGMARNPGHHVGFGNFRDQKISFMRKTLFLLSVECLLPQLRSAEEASM